MRSSCLRSSRRWANPAVLWRAVRDQRIEIITSPQLLAELARVLARPKFRRYATVEEVEAFVAEVARYGVSLPDPADPAPVSRDPNDDYLVALARSAAARAVVSGDRDLTEMADADPPVLTPAASVAQLL
ncbi:MAG TPA: putative toxin-antitoxin system toxin component, PIN family [Acidimicrobiales bacterium]|nr:putative toxin-antitoxin system toxin component, PIN family [Acidimicrobiales bacterium]